MPKKGIHPDYFKSKIICDGKVVLEVGMTKEELVVDIWSGNHPFYHRLTAIDAASYITQ